MTDLFPESESVSGYTVEKFATEAEWLKARLSGIGASECSAVVRRSRWCSPFGLYVRKLEGRVEDDDDSGHPDARQMGKYLEPVIKQLFIHCGPKLDVFYRNVHSRSLQEFYGGTYQICRSAERPHVFCTPDTYLIDTKTESLVSVLECKAAYFDAFNIWKEKVPIAYLLQCQQTLYVLGLESMYIAVLGNGLQFKWHPVERDQQLIDRLLPRLDEFWQRVIDRSPPPIDGHPDTTAALREMHGDGEPEKRIELDWEYAELGAELDAAMAAEKQAAERAAELKNKFRHALGDASTGILPDGSKVTWKTDARGARSLRRTRAQQRKGSAA